METSPWHWSRASFSSGEGGGGGLRGLLGSSPPVEDEAVESEWIVSSGTRTGARTAFEGREEKLK